MAEVTRGGPRNLQGMAFYEFESLDVYSFCPDSNDASTPATQVHAAIRLKGVGAPSHPLVVRFHGPDTLDAWIDALVEHRTYVFGRRKVRTDYPEQRRFA